jgi:hypothetical protein
VADLADGKNLLVPITTSPPGRSSVNWKRSECPDHSRHHAIDD